MDKVITDKTCIAAAAKVTVKGKTFDFAKLSIDIANVTLSTDNVKLKVGEGYKVCGEAAINSQVYSMDRITKYLELRKSEQTADAGIQ